MIKRSVKKTVIQPGMLGFRPVYENDHKAGVIAAVQAYQDAHKRHRTRQDAKRAIGHNIRSRKASQIEAEGLK